MPGKSSSSSSTDVEAFILVKVDAGKEKDVTSHLKEMKMVVEASLIYGAFDMILKVKSPLPEKLDEFIFDQLRKINGIKETATCIVASKVI